MYLELEEPVRSFEWVEERLLLHDGVRTVRTEDELGVVVVPTRPDAGDEEEPLSRC